jgi:hypothetical protein
VLKPQLTRPKPRGVMARATEAVENLDAGERIMAL